MERETRWLTANSLSSWKAAAMILIAVAARHHAFYEMGFWYAGKPEPTLEYVSMGKSSA